jgi:hypothetical protein
MPRQIDRAGFAPDRSLRADDGRCRVVRYPLLEVVLLDQEHGLKRDCDADGYRNPGASPGGAGLRLCGSGLCFGRARLSLGRGYVHARQRGVFLPQNVIAPPSQMVDLQRPFLNVRLLGNSFGVVLWRAPTNAFDQFA